MCGGGGGGGGGFPDTLNKQYLPDDIYFNLSTGLNATMLSQCVSLLLNELWSLFLEYCCASGMGATSNEALLTVCCHLIQTAGSFRHLSSNLSWKWMMSVER